MSLRAAFGSKLASELQQLTVGAFLTEESGERELANCLQQPISAWDFNQSLADASLPSEFQQLTFDALLTESLGNVSLPVAVSSSFPLGTLARVWQMRACPVSFSSSPSACS